MVQFYFLSILLNALAGFFLVSGFMNDAGKGEGGGSPAYSGNPHIPAFLKNESLRLVIGVLCMVVGLLKILSSTQGDIPVIGDLFPALAGLMAGFVLAFDFYRNRSSLEENRPAGFGQFLLNHKKAIGFTAIASAALHFLFPSVLLL
ncbi:MAG: hypothetical protein LBL20_00900 [Treponema sp.]|jgi:hypothetical protein|nr:hypothetical protein [Treponema sp.]